MEYEREMGLNAEYEFDVLYDEFRAAVEAAYEEADRRVSAFALSHDVFDSDVWDLIADEASLRDDEALKYLANHSPGDRTTPSLAGAVLGLAAQWAWKKWANRRRQ